jgi:hypothetical protein
LVTTGAPILASDINTIIGKINGEDTARGTGHSAIGNVSADAEILGQKFKDTISANALLGNTENAHHCYCQSGGLCGDYHALMTGPYHNGCAAYSFSATASSGNFDAGDVITAATINQIEADIDTLVSACDCNLNNSSQTLTFYCGNASYCACHGQKACTNYNVCDCNLNCTCNSVCYCHTICYCEYT